MENCAWAQGLHRNASTTMYSHLEMMFHAAKDCPVVRFSICSLGLPDVGRSASLVGWAQALKCSDVVSMVGSRARGFLLVEANLGMLERCNSTPALLHFSLYAFLQY